MIPPKSPLLSVVTRSWSDVLEAPYDARFTWAEAGGDSIRSLALLLALETALGRRLSLDLIDPEMSAAELALRIERGGRGDTLADLPTMFVVTGLFGDTPGLAAFRRAFAGRIQFHVITLPDLDASAAVLRDMRKTALSAAEEIRRLRPEGDIILGGFSFGGLSAYETAQHLTGGGRTVALLVILDSYFPSTLQIQPANESGRFLTGRYWTSMKPARDVMLAVAPINVMRRATLAAVQRFKPALFAEVRFALLGHFRVLAINEWKPVPIETRVLLAISGDLEPLMLAKWSALCANLQIVRTKGGHADLFGAEQLAVLVPAVESAIAAALQPH